MTKEQAIKKLTKIKLSLLDDMVGGKDNRVEAYEAVLAAVAGIENGVVAEIAVSEAEAVVARVRGVGA